ncbi:MAG: hypothetical protein M0T72_12175 [Candidatus Dormibacteraeota bacterium]|nr:hypothetical protein [Candidatus Dormibacteraeota bacterium]
MTRMPLRPYVAILALVVVGAVAAIALAPAPAPDNANPSSWSTGTGGSWALYHLSMGLGTRPERLTGSGLPAALVAGATLVEYQPTVTFSGPAARAIVAFVRSGGRLVLAGGATKVVRPLLSRLGLAATGHLPARALRERLPLRGTAPLLVEMGAGPGYVASTSAALPLLGGELHPAAEVVPLGRGEAIVLNSAYPLSNLGLRGAQDGLFAARALGLAPGRTVLFDEIHHGYQLGDGIAALLWGTTLGASALVLAALCLLFLASAGRRLGRPLPAAQLLARRGTEDHLEAVANLYSRTGDRRTIAERYRSELAAGMAGRPVPTEGTAADGRGPARELLKALGRASQEGTDGPTLVALAERATRAALDLAGTARVGGR